MAINDFIARIDDTAEEIDFALSAINDGEDTTIARLCDRAIAQRAIGIIETPSMTKFYEINNRQHAKPKSRGSGRIAIPRNFVRGSRSISRHSEINFVANLAW